MFPALMAMMQAGKGIAGAAGGALGGAGGVSNLGMGSQMMGSQAGGQMPMSMDYQPMGGNMDTMPNGQPIGGAMDMVGGQPVGGELRGYQPSPSSGQMDKDFMGVIQQGMGQAQPQMQPLPPIQDEYQQPYQQTPQYYRPPYGLMGY